MRKLNEAMELLRLAVTDRGSEPTPDIDVSFLNQRLDSLDFGPGYTVRLRHMFENTWTMDNSDLKLVTVRDLVALSEADILRQVNIGKQCLLRLKAMLAPHGLHFGMGDLKLRSVA
jgi:hypothetical protein